MKYTENNIQGITFTTGVSDYIILEVKGERLHLLEPETGWEDPSYLTKSILGCLNSGAYKVISSSEIY